MNKSVIIVVVILALAAGGIFVANNRKDTDSSTDSTSQNSTGQEPVESDDQPAPTAVEASEVAIQDFAFKPGKITVKKGTKVTWTNKDTVQHTVTPDDEGAFEGSELLAKDASYSVTFDEVGSFAYHCKPHPQMTGTVEVTE